MNNTSVKENPNKLDIVLSASSIKTYKQCGLKFKFQKIDKAEVTHQPYHYGWVGTIVHNSIYYAFADYFDTKWHVNKLKNLDDVKKFFLDAWNGHVKLDVTKALVEEGELATDKPIFKEGSIKEMKYIKLTDSEEERWKLLAWDLIKVGYVFVQDYLLKLTSDPVNDIKLEQEIKFPFDMNYDVIGYIDILLNVKGKLFFFDLKTTKQPPQSIDEDIQFYLYRYGLKYLNNLNYYPNGYYVHLRSKEWFPAKTVDQDILTKNHYQITSLIKGMEARDFTANRTHLCNFCDYRGYCFGSHTYKSKQQEQKDLEDSIGLVTEDSIETF